MLCRMAAIRWEKIHVQYLFVKRPLRLAVGTLKPLSAPQLVVGVARLTQRRRHQQLADSYRVFGSTIMK